MTTILMSIKPKYVNKILGGTKKYEYRKIMPKRRDIEKIVIYETSPVKKIVGEVEVINVISDKVDNIWNKTYRESGIKKEDFYKYYSKSSVACVYQLGKVLVYKKELDLKDINIDFVPQSYIYLEERN